jgi:hypothetical protein
MLLRRKFLTQRRVFHSHGVWEKVATCQRMLFYAVKRMHKYKRVRILVKIG